ncbi:MAG: CaiB/BaiF CoA transferase family protein [Aequoribacter sp.]|jgi:crotonobetainyl-CoA:carnitine CoA-transferase CaiB-like acyl-CoA transferase|uniref:CaiB/BaiF CoA transferase family protein n=1 Tax=Aequoribacter sp. TaxID=2847771 RepID=UPI003C524662
MPAKPLDGIKVIEIGQLVAGPFCGTLLGYFGAEIIKVESPGKGDALRGWRALDESGTSYWWYSIARNKKSVTANLRTEAGRAVVKRLIETADVVIENFRPGTMEKWGLGPDDFKESNPSLVYTRISGYGQTGPLATRPGYASVSEAFSGFRYLNGFPDRPPVRPNLSMGDSLAGLHAAFGTLLSLLHRERHNAPGQVVDIAIYESMYNLMESVVPEYVATGAVREPSGSTLTGIVPTNTYLCADKKYVVIGGNGDSIYKRLMHAAGHPDLAEDPRMADNAGRVEHEATIDAALADWTASITSVEVLRILSDADVPSGPMYSVEDMLVDPQYQARGMFETVQGQEGEVTIPAIMPKLGTTPGETQWAGPGEVGGSSEEVYLAAGFSESEIQALRATGDI